ncbi:PIG-L deacetylase family protein [Mesorhizobium sp. ORM8.1]
MLAFDQSSHVLDEFTAVLNGGDGSRGAGLMIVVAHPDDETIGVGGHLAALPACQIVHVTDGAPRDLTDAQAHGFETWQGYARARRLELEAAFLAAGLPSDNLIDLGFPDAQAAAYLAELTQALAHILADAETRFICTHPFEGGHPDHDATAFAVHGACRLLRRDRRQAPYIIEMAFYSAGPQGPVFQNFAGGCAADCIEIDLSEPDFQLKQKMLACHKTQQRTLAPFLEPTERFRLAPAYDFHALPNEGRLYYQSLPISFDPAAWLSAVAVAHQKLGFDQP